MTGMFDDTLLSTTNYDKLLQAWSTLNLQENVSFSANKTSYSSAATITRQTIIDVYKWDISDAGLAP